MDINYDILLEWIGAEYEDFSRMKGMVLSTRYPIAYIWTKAEQDVKNRSQLLYYGKSYSEPEWESIWEVKEEYLKTWNNLRKKVDEEDESIFDEVIDKLRELNILNKERLDKWINQIEFL